jgi:hypothetical protein
LRAGLDLAGGGQCRDRQRRLVTFVRTPPTGVSVTRQGKGRLAATCRWRKSLAS